MRHSIVTKLDTLLESEAKKYSVNCQLFRNMLNDFIVIIISPNEFDDIMVSRASRPRPPVSSGVYAITQKVLGLLLSNFIHALYDH